MIKPLKLERYCVFVFEVNRRKMTGNGGKVAELKKIN
jgi:hypothetical protein